MYFGQAGTLAFADRLATLSPAERSALRSLLERLNRFGRDAHLGFNGSPIKKIFALASQLASGTASAEDRADEIGRVGELVAPLRPTWTGSRADLVTAARVILGSDLAAPPSAR